MKNKNLLEENNNLGKSPKNLKLKGEISLVGFEILEPSEQEIVKKIVENYLKKIGMLGSYQEMRLTLQQHPHGKTFKHEINAFAIFREGRINASVTEWNIYSALAKVCDKILNGIIHKVKKEQRNEKKI